MVKKICSCGNEIVLPPPTITVTHNPLVDVITIIHPQGWTCGCGLVYEMALVNHAIQMDMILHAPVEEKRIIESNVIPFPHRIQ